jgi:hypothetical protein
MPSAQAEGDWLAALEADAQVKFLASLSYELTVAGRGSYAEDDGLSKPELLRGINEIQHRVSACLSQLLRGDAEISFVKSIAGSVLESSNDELRAHGFTAWKCAQARLNRAN